MLPLEFTRPGLLILLIPAGCAVLWWAIRSLSDLPAAQRKWSAALRAIILGLLVVSLAGLTWHRSTDHRHVIVLVDQSLSLGDAAAKSATQYVSELNSARGRHQVSVLSFAATPDTRLLDAEDWLQQPANSSDPTAVSGPPNSSNPNSETSADEWRKGTNLEDAIRTAAGAMPTGSVPHIVLMTDGNETNGTATAAAAAGEIRISTFPLSPRTDPEVQVSSVTVPQQVREGEPFFVEAVIDSNHADTALIEVFRGDFRVVAERKELIAGPNRFRFQQSLEGEKVAAFKVRVSGLTTDQFLDNNTASGLVFATGKPRVLIVDSEPDQIRDLVFALDDEGIKADVRPAQGFPNSLAELQNYELLMISNVPSSSLTQQQMDVARTWVRDSGGGLIMLGGDQSFGLGGYYRTTLEEILPVRSDFEKEKEKPSLAMVLVIDRSGSMDGDPIEMARTAAQSAVELLGQRDQIGVLAFDDQPYVISEMQSAANKGRIAEEISRITSGGGTSMFPSLQQSFDMLTSVSARLRHVIVLTDGQSNTADFEGLARKMAAAKITISTVALGTADTQLLETIARIGKGRFYVAQDPSQVPRIFARETVTASKSAIDEQPFLPQVIRASHALSDIDFESAPFLLGCVMTRPKPTSEVILATEKGDPLLAWWRYGLGMTAAFTSDAKSRWAAEWLSWPGFGKFWTQVVRQTMRKDQSRGIQIATQRNGNTLHLTIDAANDDGTFVNEATVKAIAMNPRLQHQTMSVPQTAPGRYETQVAATESGAWNFDVTVEQHGTVLSHATRGVMIGYSDELRIQPVNEQRLKDIAAITGGLYSPTAEQLFRAGTERATNPTAMWPWLLALAALLMIPDVAMRRIDFSLYWPVRTTAR